MEKLHSRPIQLDENPNYFKLILITQLIFWGLCGNLIRISLTDLTTYTNSYVNYYAGTCLWSNFGSCVIIAAVNKADVFWKVVLNGSSKTDKKATILFLGLTTGLCGSLSTFSSFIAEVFYKTSGVVGGRNKLPNHGYGVMELLSVVFIQTSVSIFGWHLGKDLATVVDCLVNKFGMLNYKEVCLFELFTSSIGILALIANIVLAFKLDIDHWYKKNYAVALCFSPFGVLLRYYLSKLNGKTNMVPWFPIGTFLANIIACLVIAPINILIHGHSGEYMPIITDKARLIVINAFASGFCATLSTMSTFINEIIGFNIASRRYIYYLVSFVSSFLLFLVVVGSYAWSEGFY